MLMGKVIWQKKNLLPAGQIGLFTDFSVVFNLNFYLLVLLVTGFQNIYSDFSHPFPIFTLLAKVLYFIQVCYHLLIRSSLVLFLNILIYYLGNLSTPFLSTSRDQLNSQVSVRNHMWWCELESRYARSKYDMHISYFIWYAYFIFRYAGSKVYLEELSPPSTFHIRK